MTRPLVRSGELPAPAVPVDQALVRAMNASEVHWLWAALRSWDTAADRQRALQDIEQAIKLAPERPEGYLLRSALSAKEGKPLEQRRDIELALTRDPKDANALALKVNLLLDDQFKKPAAERNFAEVEALVKLLELGAKSSPQWLTVARYRQIAWRLDDALRATRDSSCWNCYWAVGEIELRRNHVPRAARSLRVAANLAGECAPPELRQQLAEVLARSECQTVPSDC